LLGITIGRMAKFVKQYIHNQMVAGMNQQAELAEFRSCLDQESLRSAKTWDDWGAAAVRGRRNALMASGFGMPSRRLSEILLWHRIERRV